MPVLVRRKYFLEKIKICPWNFDYWKLSLFTVTKQVQDAQKYTWMKMHTFLVPMPVKLGYFEVRAEKFVIIKYMYARIYPIMADCNNLSCVFLKKNNFVAQIVHFWTRDTYFADQTKLFFIKKQQRQIWKFCYQNRHCHFIDNKTRGIIYCCFFLPAQLLIIHHVKKCERVKFVWKRSPILRR